MHNHQPTHNCTAMIADISMLLDGEMNRHLSKHLLEEINNCPTCQKNYKNYASYKTNVSQKVTRMSCGADFKDEMRAKIRGL